MEELHYAYTDSVKFNKYPSTDLVRVGAKESKLWYNCPYCGNNISGDWDDVGEMLIGSSPLVPAHIKHPEKFPIHTHDSFDISEDRIKCLECNKEYFCEVFWP